MLHLHALLIWLSLGGGINFLRFEMYPDEPVGVGIVAAYEVRAALHQRGDKGNVAAWSVELGNHEGCLAPAALLQGRE